MANSPQLEEGLALDLQQMKVRLQGTPGTKPINCLELPALARSCNVLSVPALLTFSKTQKLAPNPYFSFLPTYSMKTSYTP